MLLAAVVALLSVLPRVASAQEAVRTSDPTVYCDDAISASDCDLTKKVARKLLAVIKLEHNLHSWPPDFYVHEQFDDKGAPQLNAFAHPCGGDIDEGMPTNCEAPEGQTKPHVHITKKLLDDLIQGREERLAFVVGHEIAHITLGHTTNFAHRWKATSEVSLYAFGRQQEIGSDVNGASYGLAAGYTLEGMMNAIYRFIELDLSYSSLEGLGSSHPSWEERLVFVNDSKVDLWRSMSTFRTGVSLLATEQYDLAEDCFRNVLAAFPDAYDAHANLGYAQLMQYIDQLEPADVERFDIGHVVVGAFTRRPESLAPPVRGVNTQLWFQAVTALQQAISLKPDMIEAKANLGVAYMVAPSGPNVDRARGLFAEAIAAIPSSSLDNRTRAAIYINAGVADLAAGLLQETQEQLVSAEQQINAFSRSFRANSDVRIYGELQAALQFNAGLLFANATSAEGRNTAADFFENYLANTSPSSNWWPVAFQKYTEICNTLGRTPRTSNAFRSNRDQSYRTLGGVRFADGLAITLGEPMADVIARMDALDDGTGFVLTNPLIEETNLVDYDYFLRGTKVTATQEVLAITLSGLAAPEVIVRETGLGTDEQTLSIGMSTAAFESIVGSDYEKRVLIDPEKGYRYYRDLGLAARIVDGAVDELVITMIPYRQIIAPEVE